MSPWLPALLAAGAVLVLRTPTPSSGRRPSARRPPHASVAARAPGPPRHLPAAVVCGLAATVLLGGWGGLIVGALLAGAVIVVVPRLESRHDRRRRMEIARSAPLTVDLVCACLASGASVTDSLDAAGRAVGGETGLLLGRATAALRLGADPRSVWTELAGDPALAGLGRALARSHDTGAAVSDLLVRVAVDVRAAHRAAVEARIRTAAVRLTAPLGAALLPAFVLLGVVPVVASWIGVLL